jgi:hypothetical protein
VTTNGAIFDLAALANRPSSSIPQVSHLFCDHAHGECVQDELDDWHRSPLTAAWLKAFGSSLFVTVPGRDLWQRLSDHGVDPVDILDSVAMGIGCFATAGERAQIVDIAYREDDGDGNGIGGEPVYGGSYSTEEEHKKGLEQARLLKRFLTECLEKMSKMSASLDGIKLARVGPVFVSSFEWPEEMDKFDTTLRNLIPELQALVAHYKPIAHRARKAENHGGIVRAFDSLQSMKCNKKEVLLLLNAGYVASGKAELSDTELKDRVRSAREVVDSKLALVSGL